MEKKKTSLLRRSFVSSLLALLLCVAMLVGTTYAWFTDSVTSGTNKIISGDLDIEVKHANAKVSYENLDGDTELFVQKDGSAMLWEPGAISYENFTVSNVGTLAAKYKLTLAVGDKNTLTTDNEAHDLSEVIKVAVVDGGFSGDRAAAQALTYTTLADFNKTGNLEPKNGTTTSNTFGVVLYWAPTENDNWYNVNNGKKADDGKDHLFITFGVNVIATQDTVEKDSFDDQYDASAEYPTLAAVVSETKQKTVTEAGEAVVIDSNTTVPAASATEGIQIKASAKTTDSSAAKNDYAMAANSNLARTIETTEITTDSVTYDISYVYTETVNETTTSYDVSEFASVLTNVIELSAGLENVKVTHTHGGTATAMTAVTGTSDTNCGKDGYYYYEIATGKLTVWSSKYSSFKVSYQHTDYVAVINDEGYTTLADAINAVQDGETIYLLANINFAGTKINNKNFTLDLNGKTIGVNGMTPASDVKDRLFYLTGTSNVTIKNGTMDTATNNSGNFYGPIRTEDTAIINLSNVTMKNNRAFGMAVKLAGTSTATNSISNVTVNSTNGAGGIEAAGVVTITGCTFTQNGYDKECSCACLGISSYTYTTDNQDGAYHAGTKITATDSTFTSTDGQAVVYAYTSGGELTLNDCTLTAIGDNTKSIKNPSLSGYESQGATCVITVNSGTVTGALEVNSTDAEGKTELIVKGGTFSADPSAYVASGYIATYDNGTYVVCETWQKHVATSYNSKDDEKKTLAIGSASELALFAKEVTEGNTYNGWTVSLSANIDLTGYVWISIGSYEHPFAGTFDGSNCTISNLNAYGYSCVGLFGRIVSPAVVKNITVNNAYVRGTSQVGALIGSAYTGTVNDCKVTGLVQVSGNYQVGGITGYGYATMSNCDVNGTEGSYVKATYLKSDFEGDAVGGVIGYMAEGDINLKNCDVSGIAVSGTRKVGGVCGQIGKDVVVDSCTFNGTVATVATTTYIANNQTYAAANTDKIYVGGIVGELTGIEGVAIGTVKYCTVSGTVTGCEESHTDAVIGGSRTSGATITKTNNTSSGVTIKIVQ